MWDCRRSHEKQEEERKDKANEREGLENGKGEREPKETR